MTMDILIIYDDNLSKHKKNQEIVIKAALKFTRITELNYIVCVCVLLKSRNTC